MKRPILNRYARMMIESNTPIGVQLKIFLAIKHCQRELSRYTLFKLLFSKYIPEKPNKMFEKLATLFELSMNDIKMLNASIIKIERIGSISRFDVSVKIGSVFPGMMLALKQFVGVDYKKMYEMLQNGEIRSESLPDIFNKYEQICGIK